MNDLRKAMHHWELGGDCRAKPQEGGVSPLKGWDCLLGCLHPKGHTRGPAGGRGLETDSLCVPKY